MSKIEDYIVRLTGLQNLEITQVHMSSNRLIHEKSPYLLQHAHNPVDWYPWGDEAFAKARADNKPVFLSIGYATCHWCHVMERESFENERIAALMNEHFVNIKVDREERPDIDQIYMTAVQMIAGNGGWPLSVFLTHDREPFFGGTYFPPDRRYGRPGFDEVLSEISRLWKADHGSVIETGRQIAGHLKGRQGPASTPSQAEADGAWLRAAYENFLETFDPRFGGFGAAPKFPHGDALSLLLRIHRKTGEARALQMAQVTLEKMARGGIYDHLGGGFHRYATDAMWLVPHFEKMLYDNALLARTYLEAFQVDRNPMWAGVARETLDYVLRDMTSPEGGFYSAEDADSEGVEGKCYVWTEHELKERLTEVEFRHVQQYFNISAAGNFEAANILCLREGASWGVRDEEPLRSIRRKLLDARAQRIPPLKDDKILASWNGLMISAMSCGARIFPDGSRYLKAAQKAADFLLKTLWDGRDLKRRYRDGESRFFASIDDYAFLIQGLLDLYETDFDERWWQAAVHLHARSDALFWDEAGGGYFFTDARDPSLLTRTKEAHDGAVPSGNSVAAMNLLRLHHWTGDGSYRDKLGALFAAFRGFLERVPHGAPALLQAVDAVTGRMKEIVIAGDPSDPQVQDMLRLIHASFLPNKVLGVARPSADSVIPLLKNKPVVDGKPVVYLCEGNTCQKPVHDLETLRRVLG